MAERMLNVKNRSAGIVTFRLPDIGVRHELAPGQVIRIPYSHLEKLSYQSGGRELMANFLQIGEDSVNDDLGIPREDEYYMSEDDIKELLLNGEAGAFAECLDFAPLGVIDLIKQYAFSLPLRDTEKIEILKEKTGFDLAKAIMNDRADKVDENAAAAPAPARRSTSKYRDKALGATEASEKEPESEASAPAKKYNVVKK